MTNKPLCKYCNKRQVKGTKGITCYKCFSYLVKNDLWSNWINESIK